MDSVPTLAVCDDLHHNALHKFKDWRTEIATPMPTFVDTGTVLIDKANIKSYRDAMASE